MIRSELLDHVYHCTCLHLFGVERQSPLAYVLNFFDRSEPLTIECLELGLMRVWSHYGLICCCVTELGYQSVRSRFSDTDQAVLDAWCERSNIYLKGA